MTPANLERARIDMAVVNKRARRLSQPAILQKISRIFAETRNFKSEDVDASLYDRFLQDDDRARCDRFVQSVGEGVWPEADFRDPRLKLLASRLKARSFPGQLSDGEALQWSEFVRSKLMAEKAPWRTLATFTAELDKLRLAGNRLELLDRLQEHADGLKQRYNIA